LRDRDDQVALAREVPVYGADRQARLRDHLLHRRGVEAVAREAAPRRVEDLLATGGEVFRGDTWHGSQSKTNDRS
jgi:hypothetical protein